MTPRGPSDHQPIETDNPGEAGQPVAPQGRRFLPPGTVSARAKRHRWWWWDDDDPREDGRSDV